MPATFAIERVLHVLYVPSRPRRNLTHAVGADECVNLQAPSGPRRDYRFKPSNSTMSLVVTERAMARRLRSCDQAKSVMVRPSVKCVS